jgi:S-adenosylmethionine hydrolase
MPDRIITLTTDFGTDSPYIAEMKGVIYTLNPQATVVDITHAIPPQDIAQGSLVLAQTSHRFPSGTIHVAVIDPGVGSSRRILYAEVAGQHFVLPDNGLLSRVIGGLANSTAPFTMIAVENRAYWRTEVSTTFHGRDIMAPVAAHLSLGVDPLLLGPPQSEITLLRWPEAKVLAAKIQGEVISIDSFGNLVTNITAEMLAPIPKPEQVSIRCDEHETVGVWKTYADQPPMTLVALVGSSGKLELAIVDDSAKMMLGVRVGEKVTLSW